MQHEDHPSPIESPATARSRGYVCWLAVFLTCLALYLLTGATTVGWQDSGQFAQRVQMGELVPPHGLALAHPLHYWLGRAVSGITGAEPARTLPWLSALFGAITIANLLVIVRSITGRPAAAFFSAASLAIAHTFWRMSTTAECYTITTALLSAEILLILRWNRTGRAGWIMLAMFINGLSLANHNQALLDLPVLGILLIIAAGALSRRWLSVAWGCLLWVIGASPFLGLIALQASQTGDLIAAVQSALFGSGWQADVLTIKPDARNIIATAAFAILCFPGLFYLMAIGGMATVRSYANYRGLQISLAGLFVIHFLFVIRYNIQEQYTFMLPVYLLLAIYAGMGLATVLNWKRSPLRQTIIWLAIILLAATPLLYAVAPALARKSGVLGSRERNKPYRDDYTYLFQAWGRGKDTSADQVARKAIALAGQPGTIVIEDGMIGFAVAYHLSRNPEMMVKVTRQKSLILDDVLAQQSPVVLIPAERDHPTTTLPTGWHWERRGDLYQALPTLPPPQWDRNTTQP